MSEHSLDASAPSNGEVGVLVFGRRDARVCWLRRGDSIVVGRVPPADVVLDDRSLSRRHARLTVEEGCVVLQDLGSRNGVSVHGSAVTEARLRVGDRAQLGGVTLVVQSAEAARIGSFETLLDEARSCIASVESAPPRSPLALLLVRAADEHRAEVCAALRAIDLAAVYGPNMLAVLLKSRSEGQVTEWLTALAPRVAFALRAGVALYPDVATRAEGLVAAARAALDRATAEAPVVFASASRPDADETVGAEDKDIVAVSPRSQHVLGQARRAARSELPILVLGETGVGKEVLARAIHARSPRAERPFLVVNCAALPPTLMESVLFGHEKGAFTGAVQTRAGLFEQADGGTLFLDEVGELSPAAQAALLRVLENKTLTRIGARSERTVDVRLLAATHRDLPALCSEGRFREDLLHRLNTVTLVLPPLRERAEEIPNFVERFLRRSNLPSDCARTISPEALAALCDYHWPGNVRQLKNVVERASVLALGNVIDLEDLPQELLSARTRMRAALPLETLRPPAAADLPMKERLRQHEAELLKEALAQAQGNRTRAAKLLNMPLRTFMKRLKQYAIK
jgi:DNA-binding NtrC family response regulator